MKIRGSMIYITSEEEEPQEKVRQIIDLSEYELVRSSEETTKRQFTFEIIGPFVPKYHFQAESIQSQQEWMEAIGKAIDRYHSNSRSVRNVIGKTFIVLNDGKLYKIENYEHHHQYEVSRSSMQSQSALRESMYGSNSPSFSMPAPKYTPVEIPILTKQQRKCLLLPIYRNKPFEIKDSSSRKPLILLKSDNHEVIFLPAW